MSSRFKISIVNYYNTLPFLYGINHSQVNERLDIQLDIPSICAQKLKTNEVDIGLVPVALLPELPNYKIITNYCIGTNGKVDSVKLYSHVPLESITEILLDYQSKTSITLVKVLNQFFWKKPIAFTNALPNYESNITGTQGAVIIGDRTFGLSKYPFQYDLAEEWQKYTKLPFVFACWVITNTNLDPTFIDEFDKSLSFGIHHIKEAIAEKPITIKGFDPYDYLENKINYLFDSPKQNALNEFLNYVKKLH